MVVRYSSTESGGIGLGTSLTADDYEALHTIGRPREGVKAKSVILPVQNYQPEKLGRFGYRHPL